MYVHNKLSCTYTINYYVRTHDSSCRTRLVIMYIHDKRFFLFMWWQYASVQYLLMKNLSSSNLLTFKFLGIKIILQLKATTWIKQILYVYVHNNLSCTYKINLIWMYNLSCTNKINLNYFSCGDYMLLYNIL